jgi:hypothetical protein
MRTAARRTARILSRVSSFLRFFFFAGTLVPAEALAPAGLLAPVAAVFFLARCFTQLSFFFIFFFFFGYFRVQFVNQLVYGRVKIKIILFNVNGNPPAEIYRYLDGKAFLSGQGEQEINNHVLRIVDTFDFLLNVLPRLIA